MLETGTQNSKDISRRHNPPLSKVVQSIIDSEHINQNQLAAALEVNQGTLSKFLKAPMTVSLPLHSLVKLCQDYDLDLREIVRDDFSYQTLATREQAEKDTQPSALLRAADLGDNFIVDPSSPAFNGYLQTYHCYFHPTRDKEDELLLGKLHLSNKDGICRAEFKLYSDRSHAETGNPSKVYSGFAVISSTLHSMYVFLASKTIGEISVLNFSHFNLNLQHLDCRIAEVLTNSAGSNHIPTVHRMLLSREPIAEEHLNAIKPHLLLNSDTMMILDADLTKIPCATPNLLDHLAELLEPKTYYSFTENYVRYNAEVKLDAKQVQQLLSDFRSHSIGNSCNKVNADADNNLHTLLTEHGYYASKKPICGHSGEE